MGVPIPQIIKNALEIMKGKGGTKPTEKIDVVDHG
jgi:phage-related holin